METRGLTFIKVCSSETATSRIAKNRLLVNSTLIEYIRLTESLLLPELEFNLFNFIFLNYIFLFNNIFAMSPKSPLFSRSCLIKMFKVHDTYE